MVETDRKKVKVSGRVIVETEKNGIIKVSYPGYVSK